ncbi:MAG: hypothetical protein SFY69_08365 [Planctomycetota bacterium]|nr:hypothetical protein [Planctomycetota bacterium]
MNLARVFSAVDLVGVACVAGLTLLGYLGVVRPAQQAAAAARHERAQLDEQRGLLDAREREVRTLREQLARAEADLGTQVVLGPASGLTSRLAAIPELGDELGVLVREVAPRQPTQTPRYGTIPIVVGGECPPHSFAPFLGALRERFPDMETVAFGVGARPDAPDEPARFTVEMIWYTRAGDAARADADTTSRAERP